MSLPTWLRGSAPGYGRPVPLTKSAAMVTIRSRDGMRRVSLRPALDPSATSMRPIPGWRADACTNDRAADHLAGCRSCSNLANDIVRKVLAARTPDLAMAA